MFICRIEILSSKDMFPFEDSKNTVETLFLVTFDLDDQNQRCPTHLPLAICGEKLLICGERVFVSKPLNIRLFLSAQYKS